MSLEEYEFPLTLQEYEYPGVPPETDEENSTELPESEGFWDGTIVTDGSVLTVWVIVELCPVPPLVSVTTTYTESDPDEVKSSVHWLLDPDWTELPLR